MAHDKGYMIWECGVGKQQIEVAGFNFAGAAPGSFVKRAHVTNRSVVVRPVSGRLLAGDIPGLPRDNMFARKLSQGKIGLVRSVQTPARDFVPTFDETANVIVERTLTAATRQIVPDCDFHLSTPIGIIRTLVARSIHRSVFLVRYFCWLSRIVSLPVVIFMIAQISLRYSHFGALRPRGAKDRFIEVFPGDSLLNGRSVKSHRDGPDFGPRYP